MSSQDAPRRPIFIVSDGTGDTAKVVVTACLKQFQGASVPLRVFPNTQSLRQLREVMLEAARAGAMVVLTQVRPEMRAEAERLAERSSVVLIDLVGPMLDALSGLVGAAPLGTPGLLHVPDDSYFRRVEAVEFTVKADDGKEPRMLLQADIVLVGVSRTSKTPLSVYLAHKGYKVGNVPLVLDRPPPPELFHVDQRRVFALTIDPYDLQRIRRQRLETMRLPGGTNYGQMDYILAELEYAEDLFTRNRTWPVIDVTGKAVEETAAIILKTLGERGLAHAEGDAGQLH